MPRRKLDLIIPHPEDQKGIGLEPVSNAEPLYSHPRRAYSRPGTRLFEELKAAGRIVTTDWTSYSGEHVVYRPAKMTVEELYWGHKWVKRQFSGYRSIGQRSARRALQQGWVMSRKPRWRDWVTVQCFTCLPMRHESTSTRTAGILRLNPSRWPTVFPIPSGPPY